MKGHTYFCYLISHSFVFFKKTSSRNKKTIKRKIQIIALVEDTLVHIFHTRIIEGCKLYGLQGMHIYTACLAAPKIHKQKQS